MCSCCLWQYTVPACDTSRAGQTLTARVLTALPREALLCVSAPSQLQVVQACSRQRCVWCAVLHLLSNDSVRRQGSCYKLPVLAGPTMLVLSPFRQRVASKVHQPHWPGWFGDNTNAVQCSWKACAALHHCSHQACCCAGPNKAAPVRSRRRRSAVEVLADYACAAARVMRGTIATNRTRQQEVFPRGECASAGASLAAPAQAASAHALHAEACNDSGN